ncbi:MAG: signal recognition particle-docking protein FtsY [Actinomycetota bacterium]|nr:signal recognition particle-docking protein FtsY [Actinomycetota bacterium]
MELALILILVGLALLGTAAAVAVSLRRRRPELEAPPEAPPQLPAEAPPRPVAPEEEVAPDVEPEPLEAPEPLPVDLEPEPADVPEPAEVVEPEPVEALPTPVRPRFRDRLGKARSLLAGYVGSILSRSSIDEETWDELEEALIRADVGVGLTSRLLDGLRERIKSEGIKTPPELVNALKEDLTKSLAQTDEGLHHEAGAPNVWLFVGVNGVGKTTTIGKVGLREAAAGRTVVMAAGDTFRAAAAEQLGLWAERVGADLVRGNEGGDPGSVVFDAVERAAARGADLVLADTAGRLHTKVNLMEELKKVRRVAERPPGRLTEVLLVIDATTGQNGLVQARQFAEAVAVTGVVLTKLDGTAKGGIVLAIQDDMGLPVKLVGLGEGPEDLVDFDPEEFVDALFA